MAARFAQGAEVDFAYTPPDGAGRFRGNAYLQRDTAALVFRTVVAEPRSITALGLPDTVRTLAERSRGLVLVAGPTGSGKTTTLAAMVDHINRTRSAHIVTIEDPIEVLHTDDRSTISQRELGVDTTSFAVAMRAALRQDPDVVLVGEMRDADTVSTALMAAETGHLVLSTLHTTDASETINRIVEFFPLPEQRQVRLTLAGVLRGTVCQRLVPTADGAARVVATEIMVVNGRVQSWIVDPTVRDDVAAVIAGGDYEGMHSFDQSILDLLERGEIDLRSAMAASTNPHDLSVELRRRGIVRPSAATGGVGDADAEALTELVDRLASAEGGPFRAHDDVGAGDESAHDVLPAERGWFRRRRRRN